MLTIEAKGCTLHDTKLLSAITHRCQHPMSSVKLIEAWIHELVSTQVSVTQTPSTRLHLFDQHRHLSLHNLHLWPDSSFRDSVVRILTEVAMCLHRMHIHERAEAQDGTTSFTAMSTVTVCLQRISLGNLSALLLELPSESSICMGC